MDETLDFPFERLRWARQKAGYQSAKAFAEKVGVGDVTYRAYENGQVGFAKYASRFAKLLGVSTDWLLEGGEVPDGAERELANNMTALSLAADLDISMVREVDITYAMGDGAVVSDYPDTGLLPFGRNFLAMVGIRSADTAFICRGQGDSMAPTIYDRDMVMVDTSRNRVTMQDQIWALTVAGAGMIKRIRPLPEGRVMVLSDNPLVPEQVYDGEDVYIVGKVIWIGRTM